MSRWTVVTGLVLVTVCRTTTTTYTSLQVADTDADTVNATGSTAPLVVFGGQGNDKIYTGSGSDIVLGDHGIVSWNLDGNPVDLDQVLSTQPETGGVDVITTGEGSDLVVGGTAGDTIDAGNGDNIVLGDSGRCCSRPAR